MANITVLKPDEAKIATMSMLWNSTKDIATILDVDSTYVESILNHKYVQDFIREVETQDAIAGWLHMKVKYAKEKLLPQLIDWVEKIVKNVSAEKWNKNHVEMFKIMLQDIKKEEPKIIQNILNQVNISSVEKSSSEMEELDEMISSLPSSVQVKFWEQVVTLATKIKMDYDKRIINW